MGRKHPTKKAAARISDAVKDRIVALALKNPECGAKRLVPLLKQEKITISASTVYKILKRNDLQTRDKRLAKSNPPPKKPKKLPRKPATPLSAKEKDLIVSTALEKPTYGARRLAPLLQKEGIRVSESTIYKILKQHGLETRIKRLTAREIQQNDAMPEPLVTASPAVEIESLPSQYFTREDTLPFPIHMAEQSAADTEKRFFKVLTPLRIFLIALVVFIGVYVLRTMNTTRNTPEANPEAHLHDANQITSSQSLDKYRAIWKRNLFGVSPKKKPAVHPKVVVPETIKVEEEDLGLRLVGTVVSDTPQESVAIIYSSASQSQLFYYEGDKANGVKVKRILRNSIIISTRNGDKRLAVETDEKPPPPSTTPASDSVFTVAEKIELGQDVTAIKLKREDVDSELADIDKVLQEISTLPYMLDNQPVGIRLSRLPTDCILRKMGLRLGDVIVNVNGDPITDPQQCEDFLRTLTQERDVSIHVKRNGFDQEIALSIE